MDRCAVCAADARFLRTRRRPSYELNTPRIRIVDLFAGGGGLSLGIAEAARRLKRGIKIVAAVELDPDAADVFALNFPEANVLVEDVAHLFHGAPGRPPTRRELGIRDQIGKVDLLLAGPPCQGHSDLNNHTRRQDPRNGLYVNVARATEVLRPRCVLIENVPAVRRDVGAAVPSATAVLEKAGYRVATAVIDLTDLGVPQRRRRHVLLASRDHRVEPATVLTTRIPCELHETRTVRWAIEDLLDVEPVEGIDAPSTASAVNSERMQWLIDNDAYDLPNAMRPKCHHGDHTYLSMYGRLRWDDVAQTITTGYGSMGQGRFVHPSRPHTITPHEAARLQTIPDFFDFGTDYPRKTWAHVIGNAVPPLLGVHIGRSLLSAMVTPSSRSGSIAERSRPTTGTPPASNEIIRKRMATTRRRDTKPELALRAELDRRNLTYLVDHSVDGSRRRADMVFPASHVAVYVDGCYWHGCPEHGTMPKANREWWRQKLSANQLRDADTDAKLAEAGWRVLRFWEHEDAAESAAVIQKVVRSRSRSGR